MKKTLIIGAIIILAPIIGYLIIMTIGDVKAMGALSPEYAFTTGMDKFLITQNNRIDEQQENSCSGYSSAYIIRHWGKEVKGDSLYFSIPEKEEMGYVAPKGVLRALENNGLKATYRTGNLNALKNEVAKGNPVIVFIRIDTEHDWLHYVPVVGYTQDSIFLAESIRDLVNCPNGKFYNRALSTSEFTKLWNTSNWKMPLYCNTFITAEK